MHSGLLFYAIVYALIIPYCFKIGNTIQQKNLLTLYKNYDMIKKKEFYYDRTKRN